MDEASAAKLEELRLGAVSQGKEWLHRALNEIPKEELRVLAAAGGVQTHSNRNWLPVSELCNSLMKVLEPSTEVGFNQKCVLTWVVFVTGFACLSHGAMLWDDCCFVVAVCRMP